MMAKKESPKRITWGEVVKQYRAAGQTEKADRLAILLAPGVVVYSECNQKENLQDGEPIHGQPEPGLEAESDSQEGSADQGDIGDRCADPAASPETDTEPD